MTETKHTPGPWEYDPDLGEIFREGSEALPPIARVNLDLVDRDQADADGFLIEAAPSMLAALKQARHALANQIMADQYTDDALLLVEIDAAIAKAHGLE